MDLPKQITKGQSARLFPSLKSSNKEQIATSIVLATFRIVPELLAELIKDIGVRLNDKTTFLALTEVQLVTAVSGRKDRPDGFIYLKNRNEWTALIEAKVGNNRLDQEQISRYLEDARANNIDALITISNEFTPRADLSPVVVRKALLNRVKLYHFSWRLILSKAQLLKHEGTLQDREKVFLLDELMRFLKDDSVGQKSFTTMPTEWPDVCKDLAVGGKLRRNDERLNLIANAFVEEFSEIALNLTDHLGVSCSAKLSNRFLQDKTLWQSSIASNIASRSTLSCSYKIPDAANDLFLEIDITKNSIVVGMEVKAPEDRKTLSGRVNWLKRSLKNREKEHRFVKVRWNSRASDTVLTMTEFADNNFSAPSDTANALSFTPIIQIQSTKIFKSRKNFISELEKAVLEFYDDHGQYLKEWVAKAPSPIQHHDIEEIV